VYVLTPGSGAVYEIATTKLAVARRAQVARQAVSMRLAPGGQALWVLCRSPRQLVRLPLERFRAEKPIPLGGDPFDFDIAPEGEAAVVSYGQAGWIAGIDLARRASQSFNFGKILSLARFRSDGKAILVGNAQDRQLAVLDVKTGRTVVHLPLAVRPDNFCFKSDGGQLFITGEGMDAVAVVYPFSTEVAETVLAGHAPGAMAECAGEDADYLLAANAQTGEVTILDIETRRVIAVVGVGDSPGFIDVTPDKQYALVLNRRSGDMAVIRLAAIAANRTKSAPLFTMIPVGSKPVAAAVRGV
jgi:YVTN family beta-propeller protein